MQLECPFRHWLPIGRTVFRGRRPIGGVGRMTGLLLLSAVMVTACETLDGTSRPEIFETLETVRFDPPPQSDAVGPNAVASPNEPQRAVVARQVFRGDDDALIPERPGASRRNAADGMSLNFNGTALEDVVRAVLGDGLGLGYLYDPRVQGTVTLNTSGPIPAEHLLPTLETVLRMNGAALVRDDALYRVVPITDAQAMAGFPQLGTSMAPLEAGFGLTVVPLRFVSADAVSRLVGELVVSPGTIRVDAQRNLVVLSGPAPDRAAIAETILSFDVDWMRGLSAGIFPLREADAATVIEELEALFVNREGGLQEGRIRFQPIERMNAVLVVTSRSDLLDETGRWIDRLDIASSTGQSLFVHNVQYGKATELAEILTEIFAYSGAADGDDARRPVAPDLEPVLVSAGPDAEGGGPAGMAGGGGRAGRGTAGTGDVRVIADDARNALLILASPQGQDLVRSALRQLDVTPAQVLIDATIAEVSLTDELRYGLQYFFKAGGFGIGDSSLVGLFGGNSRTLPPAFPGFNFVINSGGDARVVLDALSSLTDVKVISSPSIVVLDNQSATLQVGDEVPVAIRQSSSVTDPDAPIVNTIEFRDTGVILTVTPRINANGLVAMDVEQEVSNVVNATTDGTLTPTISQRRISTAVAVTSGQTVVLGGLISESLSAGRSGIPGLSRLPVVGPLFGSTTNNRERTELVIFITPRVIRDARDAQAISEEVRDRLRLLAPQDASGTVVN